MTIDLRKQNWWLALASSAGVILLLMISICGNLSSPFAVRYVQSLLLVLCGEIALAAIAIWKLKRYYKKEPLAGNGRWQLTLGDMLAIVFFCGLVMAVCRAFTPNTFLAIGVPISMGLGIGYVVCILILTRGDRSVRGPAKWFGAFGYLIAVIFFTGVMTAMQFLALIVLFLFFIAISLSLRH